MDKGIAILRYGEVENVYDDAFGLRIKARIEQDGSTKTSDLPFAFPLLPKMFQVIPKVGEGVLVITSESNNQESQRYYIGPIISQPQYNEKCKYDFGRGPAASLLTFATTPPLENIKNYDNTKGCFPNENPNVFKDDVAVVGRNTQDIILRHNETKSSDEIDIRCGIRKDALTADDDLIGKVIFNKVDPAYIQLKYQNALTHGDNIDANSVVNIVADKINIISNKDDNQFDLTNPEELIDSNELSNIMNKLHQVPHGDVLIKFINLFKTAFLAHKHNYNNLPPVVNTEIDNFNDFNLDDILSKHVRIS